MTVFQGIGIDPGIVHSGVASLIINDASMDIFYDFRVISGDTPQEHADGIVQAVTELHVPRARQHTQLTIEGYRDRGSIFTTHVEMRELERLLTPMLPQMQRLENMGVKKVVKPKLLKLLGLYKFPTTHHQDLQAAARILVFRMLREVDTNALLSKIVVNHLDGHPWPVHTLGN